MSNVDVKPCDAEPKCPSGWAVLGARGNRRRAARRVVALAARNSSLAFLDQAVVSATRFLTTIIVGRTCGPEGLAFYALAFSVVFLSTNFQEAIISRPYMVFQNQMRAWRRASYAGSMLVHHGIVAATAFVGTAILGSLFLAGSFGHWEFAPIIVVATGIIPWVLLWELGRRYAFAHLRMRVAVTMDLSVSVVQVSALCLLAEFGMLTVVRAYGVIALACGAVGLVWLVHLWRRVRFEWPAIWGDWLRNWSFGKWILAGQVTATLHGYCLPWILAMLVSVKATGIYSACTTVVLLSNPLILGLSNWLGPTAAHAWSRGGVRELSRLILRTAAWLLLAMLVFLMLLDLFAERLLHMFFGEQYTGHGNLVLLIGVAAIAWSVSVCMSCGLAAVERSRSMFLGSLLGLAATFFSSIVLIPIGSLDGAAGALIIGNTVMTLFYVVSFFTVSRHLLHGVARSAVADSSD